MKTMITAALFVAGLAGGALADPVLGVWKTEVDDGKYAHVKFAPCGPNFCGKIVKSFNSEGQYDSPNVGKMLFIDMTPDGNGKYSGSAWRPANGKIYKGSMTLKGNKLKAGGCVAGIICIKNTLTRIK